MAQESSDELLSGKLNEHLPQWLRFGAMREPGLKDIREADFAPPPATITCSSVCG